MTIYVDGLLFLNFFFDFLLLMSTSVILKRNASVFRLIIGAFIGSLSIFILFLKVSGFELFLIKLYLGFLMCILCFGYGNLKKFLRCFFTFYLVSIVLGGFLFYLNIEFSYKHCGLVFFNKGRVSIFFICLVSIIVLYFYVKQFRSYKNNICNLCNCTIYIGSEKLKLTGFLDSGNTLMFKGRYVIISNLDNTFNRKKYYVICNSIGSNSLLEVIKINIEVSGVLYKDVYMGFSKNVSRDYDLLLNGGMIC